MNKEVEFSEVKPIKVALCSGGRESTAMVLYMGLDYYDVKIFADTGDDPNGKAVVDYLNRYKGWNIVEVKSHLGNIYEYYKNKVDDSEPQYIGHALPSQDHKDCSGKFKIAPIRNYLRKTYGTKAKFEVHLGYSLSIKEIGRMRESDVKYVVNRYPLIESRIDREMCAKMCQNYLGFVPERSCCDMCFERTIEDWKAFAKKNPKRMLEIIDFDESSKLYKKFGFGLNNKPLNEIVRLKVPEGQSTLIQCGCFNGRWADAAEEEEVVAEAVVATVEEKSSEVL